MSSVSSESSPIGIKNLSILYTNDVSAYLKLKSKSENLLDDQHLDDTIIIKYIPISLTKKNCQFSIAICVASVVD